MRYMAGCRMMWGIQWCLNHIQRIKNENVMNMNNAAYWAETDYRSGVECVLSSFDVGSFRFFVCCMARQNCYLHLTEFQNFKCLPYDIYRSFACPALHWLAFTPEEGLDQAKTSWNRLSKHPASTYSLHALPYNCMTLVSYKYNIQQRLRHLRKGTGYPHP